MKATQARFLLISFLISGDNLLIVSTISSHSSHQHRIHYFPKWDAYSYDSIMGYVNLFKSWVKVMVINIEILGRLNNWCLTNIIIGGITRKKGSSAYFLRMFVPYNNLLKHYGKTPSWSTKAYLVFLFLSRDTHAVQERP